MSLSLKAMGLYPAANNLVGALAGFLPKLPLISVTLPRLGIRSQATGDNRLEDLRKEIEEGNGDMPFAIDNGTILRAAPKKKHSKGRSRMKRLAPGDKQMKRLDNLVRCPACGHVKRSHFMCMNCFSEIRAFFKAKKKDSLGESESAQANLDPVDEKILYPGKYMSDYERRLKKKDWIPVREEPLLYEDADLKDDKVKP